MSPAAQKAETRKSPAAHETAGSVAVVSQPDQRPSTVAQRQLLVGISNGPRVQQAAAWQHAIDNSPRQQAAPAPVQRKANNTGLPDQLKAGVENLSGHSLDDVQVHYNSDKPAQMQAHAYAQGTDIHVAPGQEKHLPHEAWHVVQQKQGRVRSTRQLKGKVAVNDDAGLEKEADLIGQKAKSYASGGNLNNRSDYQKPVDRLATRPISTIVAQRILTEEEFIQIEKLAQQIMAKYPPANYHYVGLGKSPTPVVAYLQAYGEKAAIDATNMPLSKFGHPNDLMSSSEKRVIDGQSLNAEQRNRLWEHFDNFIIGADVAEGKNILLIDFVQTGKSLVATQRHLQEYLKERYQGTGVRGILFGMLARAACFPSAPTVDILPLAIEEQQVGGMKNTMDALKLSQVAMMIPGTLAEKHSLAARMGGEKYKPMAEYPEDFKISSGEKPTTQEIIHDPRGEHAKLRQEFADLLKEGIFKMHEGSETEDRVEREIDEKKEI